MCVGIRRAYECEPERNGFFFGHHTATAPWQRIKLFPFRNNFHCKRGKSPSRTGARGGDVHGNRLFLSDCNGRERDDACWLTFDDTLNVKLLLNNEPNEHTAEMKKQQQPQPQQQ